MSSDTVNRSTTTPPPVALLQMMTGYWISQAIYVAAKLGIADLLAHAPMSTEQLAAACDTHASSLYRVLRAPGQRRDFYRSEPAPFRAHSAGALLRTATPDSVRSLAITYNEEQYRAWGNLLHTVRTGQPAFELEFGMGPFEYFGQHPEADRVFNEAMIGWTNQVAGAVAQTYDFAPCGTIVDVGGGYGTLLAAILQRNPNARGILFDQPHVVAGADDLLARAGIADRCELVAGDFFAAVPAGDAYVLAQILHDWNDDRCVTILIQCRRAISPHGKVLVVELVLPSDEEPFFGKWLGLHMMVVAGGRERTAAEYEALFRQAGFALGQILPTSAGPSVVEAVPM